MPFRWMTILKTMNQKPCKTREDAFQRKMKGAMLLVSALFFLGISVQSFLQIGERDGALFLGLALYCALGGLAYKALLGREGIRTAYCAVLGLMVGCVASFSSHHGVLMVMWALFYPLLAASICGIWPGILIAGLLGVFFGVLFYSPLLRWMPAAYSQEIRQFYPVLYDQVFIVSMVYKYFQHQQLLKRQHNQQTLEKAMKTEHDHLMVMTTQTILSISNAVDARDTYTQRHSSRVAEYSVMLAKSLGWDGKRLEQLYNIALLHDIGKIGISDSILNKHSSLTEEEREIIKQHTVIGGEILKDLTLLPNASIGAVSHHERYDGKGYPYGLKGTQIPLEARIIGIADAFDAMNSSRVYRTRISPKIILQELRNGRGSQFDPELLDQFLPIAQQILKAGEV